MQKNSGVNDGQIGRFGGHQDINFKLLKAFTDFNLSVSGEEIMQKLGLKPGKELGDAINKVEINNFNKIFINN